MILFIHPKRADGKTRVTFNYSGRTFNRLIPNKEFPDLDKLITKTKADPTNSIKYV